MNQEQMNRLKKLSESSVVGGDIKALLAAYDKASEESFSQGVVYACAQLSRMFDQPSMAIDILEESGVDPSYAAEYDVAELRKKEPDLPQGCDA